MSSVLPCDDAVRRHARDGLEQLFAMLCALFPFQGAAFRSYRIAILALLEHAQVNVDADDLRDALDALDCAVDDIRIAFRAYETRRTTQVDPESTKPDAISAAMKKHGWENDE